VTAARLFSGAEMSRRRAAFAAELERSEVPYALVCGAKLRVKVVIRPVRVNAVDMPG
jgi:hypothetical protein